MLIFILLWFITILSLQVSAYSLDSVTIKDTLTDSGDLIEEMNLLILNNTKESVTMVLPSEAYNVKINNKDASQSNNTITLITTCSTCNLKVQYSLNNVVSEPSLDIFDFTRTMSLPLQPKNFHYSVKLPPGKIINLNDTTNIIPNGPHITTDGQGIIVNWDEQNPGLPKIYHITYKGHEDLEVSELSDELKEWNVIVLMILTLIIGFTSGWLIKMYSTKNKKLIKEIDAMQLPASLFNPDEKKIINTIKENKGQIKQKDLGKQLNWSKSKVSSIITNLEYKKVIRREKHGRNYDIFLEKDIK